MNKLNTFLKSQAFDFLLYCIGFYIVAFFCSNYIFYETAREYLILMIIFCPVGFYVSRRFKKAQHEPGH